MRSSSPRMGEFMRNTGAVVGVSHSSGRGRRIQAVEASDSTSSANISEGFFQLWILRGRSLMSQATMARYLGSAVMSAPFGKYSRRMRLAFSLLPRSHGEWGWVK